MEDWKTYKLKDVCTKIGSGATPRGGKDAYLAEGISLIRSQNVLDFEFSIDGLAFISDEQSRQLSNVCVEENDILLNITGDSVARVCQVPDAILPARVNQHVAIIRTNGETLLPELLKYYLLNPSFKSFMLGRASAGATRNALTKGMIEEFEITVPERIEEQKAIAKILSSLDDKIELNRRMNATLEAMARALFKAWFVDFEPVHANQENRPSTSASPEIANLFPNEFENGIPKGWEQKPLNQIFEVNPLRSIGKGKIAKYLDMASVPTYGHRVTGVIDRGFSSGMKFKNGDTLLARITPCLENGKTAFVDFLKDGEIGWGSTEFIVLRPKNGMPEYFAYLLCRNEDFRNFAIQSMTGTSGRQRVQVDSLGKYSLSVPPSASSIGEKFGSVLNPVIAKIRQNSEEMSCLAEIRDSLLPRLISGSIKVVF